MYVWWWGLMLLLLFAWEGLEENLTFVRTHSKNKTNRIIFGELHCQIDMFKSWEIQKSPNREQVALMSAGLACNFFKVSIYPKHERAVVELISLGRIEKGELMHKRWQGPCKHNPVGSENELFKYFHVSNKTIMRWIHPVFLPWCY